MDGIKVMNGEDLDFATRITQQEGWGYTKEDLARILSWSPDGCFVLWENGRRIGMATTMFYGSFGWVGNVVISKDHRSQGHGKTIMKRCVSHILGRGARGVRLFAYQNTRSFYEHLSFTYIGPVLVHRHDLTTADRPRCEGDIRMKQLKGEGLDQAISLDTVAFGGDRGTILRAIQKVGPDLCLGLWKDERLRGAIFGKKVLGNIEIGPWLCNLPDVRSGLHLLDALLSKNHTTVFLAVPEYQEDILKALAKRGFKVVDRIYEMILGQVPRTNQASLLSFGSLEKG